MFLFAKLSHKTRRQSANYDMIAINVFLIFNMDASKLPEKIPFKDTDLIYVDFSQSIHYAMEEMGFLIGHCNIIRCLLI